MIEPPPKHFNFSAWLKEQGKTATTTKPTPEVVVPAIQKIQIDLRKLKGDPTAERRAIRAGLQKVNLWGPQCGYCAFVAHDKQMEEVKQFGCVSSSGRKNSIRCCTLRDFPRSDQEQFPLDHKMQPIISHMQNLDVKANHGVFAVYDLNQLSLSENCTYTFNNPQNRRAALLGIVRVTF